MGPAVGPLQCGPMAADAPKGIRPDAVSRWFEEHVDDATGPLGFELLAGGHSNLTYRVDDAGSGRSWVLRRPPTGHLLASAHDMGREYRIIAALGPTDVPVPAAIGLCEDSDVNEAPFYVMAHVDGVVLHDAETTDAHVAPEARPALARSLVDVMAALHTVDPDRVGLGDLGRKTDYVARQLRRWAGQWEKSKTRELPAMEEIHRRLSADIPGQEGAAIVHGDYRFGNCLADPGGRVAAVLDWELCTLGDPMADVGYLMNHWDGPDEVPIGREPGAVAAGGFPSRQELLDRYTAATGRDVSGVGYYRAFQYWRLAAIVEGVLARYLGGQMADPDADPDAFRDQVDRLSEAALAALS